MSRFKPGQKIVCCKVGLWTDCFRGPEFNEIVTLSCYVPDDPEYIRLVEYYIDIDNNGLAFIERAFEPLAEISELTSILESEPQTQSV